MFIFIRIKNAGKRRDILDRMPYSFPEDTPPLTSAEALIEAIVRDNVQSYNTRTVDTPIFPFLTEQDIDDGVYLGKIGFNSLGNGENNDDLTENEDQAVAAAIQAYHDGLYRILINTTEAVPGGPFTLTEGSTVTFIRLVMLAGRMW